MNDILEETPQPIAYRWEWRTFAPRFPRLDEATRGLAPLSGPETTEETYFVASAEVNAKVRFDLLDVKHLREVDATGLQLWAPVAKTEFPLPKESLPEIFAAMGLEPPEAARDSYSEEQFTEELAGRMPDVTVVPVTKVRTRYVVDGCMAELTELSSGERATRTVAIESEDPAAVARAVDRLGLAGYPNTSYPVGLRRLLGDSLRYGVIDIGTNSVKFHLAEQRSDGSWVPLADRAVVTRLGQGVADTGEIQAEPLEATIRAVLGMVDEARRHRVEGLAVVGTAVFRHAANRDMVVESLAGRAGVPVEVIPGEEESRLAFQAVKQEMGGEAVVAFDTGGGSTEFTFGGGDGTVDRFSLPVGSVTYTERFGLDGVVGPDTLADVERALAEDLAPLDGRPRPDVVVGIGGAVTNLAAVSLSMAVYDPDLVQGAVLDATEIDRQIALYASRDEEGRRSVVGLQSGRAKVILAGALIVRAVLARLDMTQLTVSDRGLRHGLIRERFGFVPSR